MRTRLLLTGLVLAVTGCGYPAQRLIRYQALIEQVSASEVLPVQHYSPAAGPVTVTRIRLRVAPARAPGVSRSVVAVATGLHAPAEIGQEGDWVAFTYPGPLPTQGELRFEALHEYRVEPVTPSR